MKSKKNKITKPEEIFVVTKGDYYGDTRLPVFAARTKKTIIAYVKDKYPTHVRKKYDECGYEMYFESEEEQTYLKCLTDSKVPLIE